MYMHTYNASVHIECRVMYDNTGVRCHVHVFVLCSHCPTDINIIQEVTFNFSVGKLRVCK